MESIQLTLRKIGNSLGVILPKEAVEMLQAREGDILTMTHTEDGAKLTSYDPDFDKKIKTTESILYRYKNALRELSKR